MRGLGEDQFAAVVPADSPKAAPQWTPPRKEQMVAPYATCMATHCDSSVMKSDVWGAIRAALPAATQI